MVFVDDDLNRRRLFENTTLPATVKDKVADGRIQDALTELFATYTPTVLWDGFSQRANIAKAVDFTISSAVTRVSGNDLALTDGGLGFTNYDAVVVINDLTPNSAHGVERWPGNLTRPLFYGKDGTFYLHIDPFWLQPALFAHEVLDRNLPWLLKEYQIGDRTLVLENGITFDRTPFVNPRTGENIEPLVRAYEGKTPLVEYSAGYADVDGDGIVDCMDPFITPTADNVDGDFLPDRFDLDLHFDHRPYSWMFASRTRPGAALQGVLGMLRRPGR
jgi:hypothetical protein